MHTSVTLMIVEATLNDGDFGVITFDPWYDSEGPIYSLSDDVAYVFCLISQNQSGFLVEIKKADFLLIFTFPNLSIFEE